MPVTIISGGRPFEAASAAAVGEDLWLSPEDLTAATGWERKPQGLCRDERCVPIPHGREAEFDSPDRRFNLAAFARYLEMPIVHEDARATWLIGEPASDRAAHLASTDAPDFALPDLAGVTHRLSDYRGKKVLLLTWASW